MIILGITGSIGMGKTTAANILRTHGVPVHDSDAAVHDVFNPQSADFTKFQNAFPLNSYKDIYTKDGLIDRGALGWLVFNNDVARKKLESVTHPLVRAAQDDFILKHTSLGTKIIGLDIPLLFETGAQARVDYTIVVSAPKHIQKARVLSRQNMNEEKFNAILNAQMPSHDKCARADFVVQSGLGLAHTTKALKSILNHLCA